MDYRSCTFFRSGEYWYYQIQGYLGEDPCAFHWTMYWESWGPFTSLEAARNAQDALYGSIPRIYTLRGEFSDKAAWIRYAKPYETTGSGADCGRISP